MMTDRKFFFFFFGGGRATPLSYAYGHYALHRVGHKRSPIVYTQLRQILAYSQNYFTIPISTKFSMQQSLNIPPHLKRVATLPCEIFMSRH